MGSSNSKEKSAKKRMSGAALLEKRRKALERYGVLVPPAFGVTGTPSQKGTGPPLSVQHRLLQTAADRPVGYMAYLHETDLSTCILKDHMEPGIWIAAQSAANTMLRISLLANKVQQRQTDGSIIENIPMQLFLEKKLPAIHGIVQLRTEPNSNQPALSGSMQLTKSASLFASISNSGMGWLGAHFDRTFPLDTFLSFTTPSPYSQKSTQKELNASSQTTVPTFKSYDGPDIMCRNTINCKCGTWIPLQWRSDTTVQSNTMGHRSYNQNYFNNYQCMHGYAAINLLGATAAVHGRMDDKWQQQPSLRTYFSANLSDIDRPPLQITLEHDNQTKCNILCLSQVLAFDRWQINPLEDRAPKIRNTMAWTVRVETKPFDTISTKSMAEDSGAHNNVPETTNPVHWSAGVAWQLNRCIAVKAVLQNPSMQSNASRSDTEEKNNIVPTLLGAIIFKRWKQPRITCSLLGRYNVGGGGMHFVGVGIELETGHIETDADAYYYNHHPSRTVVLDGVDNNEHGSSIPATRAVLPNEV